MDKFQTLNTFIGGAMLDGQNPDLSKFDKIHSVWLCWEED